MIDDDEVIDSFEGENAFLSNFYEYKPIYHGLIHYKTAEHMYQAFKTDDPEEIIKAESPGKAKRLGQKVVKIDDWDEKRHLAMKLVIMCKFAQSDYLLDRLIKTNGKMLIEGNTWHDNYWGECYCGTCDGGLNYLGEILMDIRGYLK